MQANAEFQFTHPGRGATNVSAEVEHHSRVSIHAPREGCDGTPHRGKSVCTVSIHAPREGCDLIETETATTGSKFQFTHPGRGAT